MADSYICPTCEHEVTVGKSCAICARKAKRKPKKKTPAKKPWEQDKMYDGLDIPSNDFDYDDFVEREFGTSNKPPHKKIGIAWYWWLTALLLSVLWVFIVI